ncbi:hypothetical protein BH23ACT12_BH23ACT12_01010 [soil metagenome]
MAARLARRIAFLGLVVALSGCARTATREPSDSTSSNPEAEATLETSIWEGRWEFNYTLVRLVGATEEETTFEPGNKIRRIWEVTPGCDDKPCNSEISATNPDEPGAGAVVSTVTYDDGVYRINQIFPPEVSNACKAGDGRIIPQAFEATNTVEVTPTDFEVRDGVGRVTQMTATKRTSFIPKAEAATLGGTCEPKSAEWEATVVPSTS